MPYLSAIYYLISNFVLFTFCCGCYSKHVIVNFYHTFSVQRNRSRSKYVSKFWSTFVCVERERERESDYSPQQKWFQHSLPAAKHEKALSSPLMELKCSRSHLFQFFCNITGFSLLQVGCLPCFGSVNYNIISRSSKFIKNELHYKSFKGFCQDYQTTLFSRTSLYCFFWISGVFARAKRASNDVTTFLNLTFITA